ncbi:MAG: putative cache sensor protein [Holophagaceae bacterium]|nr:putative cache sensor protein [Holophagaceae bacterium]
MTPHRLLLLLAAPALVTTLGAQTPKTEDAVSFLKEAVVFYKTHGRAAALREFTLPTGKFRRFGGELYITVYDIDGKCLAHGQEPGKVGINALHSKDPDGKEIIKDRIDLAKAHGKGWQDVKYKNPKTGHPQPKAMYYEMHEGLVFATGIYKG